MAAEQGPQGLVDGADQAVEQGCSGGRPGRRSWATVWSTLYMSSRWPAARGLGRRVRAAVCKAGVVH